jgi:hypothetical protein
LRAETPGEYDRISTRDHSDRRRSLKKQKTGDVPASMIAFRSTTE